MLVCVPCLLAPPAKCDGNGVVQQNFTEAEGALSAWYFSDARNLDNVAVDDEAACMALCVEDERCLAYTINTGDPTKNSYMKVMSPDHCCCALAFECLLRAFPLLSGE